MQSNRLATNRPNPYQLPGVVHATSGAACPCTRTASAAGRNYLQPLLPTAVGFIITPALNQLINQFVFDGASTGSQVAAPPCNLQGDFASQGQVPAGQPASTHYPHVWAAAPPQRPGRRSQLQSRQPACSRRNRRLRLRPARR